MGLLTSLLAQSVDRSPSSDFWYYPIGGVSKAGIQIDEMQALRISPVLQGIRFVSQTVAGLPRHVMKQSEDGRSREKVARHPLNKVLRFQPNPWQTAFQFHESSTALAMMHGIALAERVYAESGELEALVPLDPKTIAKIEQGPNGKIRYTIRRTDGSARVLLQEQVFALTGFGLNGVRGLPLVQQMRETAGLAVATESYGASFFSNSAMPSVVLTSPKNVGDVTRRRMKDDWNLAYSGDRQHGTALLEDDTKVQVLSSKNDEAQFIETRKFLIAEFSRFIDVTPHRLSDMENSSYNNVEQMSLETVVYTLKPWVDRWEQACYRDLLTEEEKEQGFYVKFSLDGLLRGDTTARQAIYQSGINTGWLTRNEVREKEDMNPLEGLDEPLQPQNMAPVGEEPEEEHTPPDEAMPKRALAIARAAAERVVRREVQAVAKWRERKAWDDDGWRDIIRSFYNDHAAFVRDALGVDDLWAFGWCKRRCDHVLICGTVADTEEVVEDLVREALK